MTTIEIQLLGRFSARRSGEEIPPGSFGGRLVRVLIRLLVTRRGSFVSRDALAEALWPERMPADPTANLRVLVQRARAALGDPSLIVTGPGGYSFAAGGGCVVDTEVFLAAVHSGQDYLAVGRAGAALRDFRSALERWAGEPLAEDAYEDWAQEFRAILRRGYLQALEGGAEAALALRDPGHAVALAERAVAQEPLREPAALLLARALTASGDQVAALRTIDSLRRRLAEEVGLEPSPEALALEARLQRGEPLVEASRRPVATLLRPAFEGLAFVGRDDELQTLLTAMGGPEPGTVIVVGSAGTGKSRLLAEAAAQAEVPVLAVRAFLPERDEPWSLARAALLREALALDVKAAAVVPDRAAQALADVLPELEDLRPIGTVVVDHESRRALALEAAARMMAVAATNGSVIVVDDLQWADATSLAVLGLIARRFREASMALAYRPEEVAVDAPVRTFVDELRATRGAIVEISVGPLTPETISLLVADEAVAAAIAEETDRTPLAIAEAIRSLCAERVLQPDARGRWEPRRSDAVQRALEVARGGQRRAISVRVERQPHDRRRLLSLLALLARESPARIFARATAAAEVKTLDDLDALARAGLARLGDAGWATAHNLIAELTSALDDYGQASDLIEVALAEAAGDQAARAEALTMAAFFDLNQNEIHQAEARAAEALSLFERLGEPAGVASVLDLRALAAVFGGRLVEASEHYDRAARLYRNSGRLLKVGAMRAMRAWMLLMNDRAEEALREVDEALEAERSLGQAEGEAFCLWLRGEVLCGLGRLEEARRDALAGLALSRALGNREWISMNLRGFASSCEAHGDLERAEAALREAIEVGVGIPLTVYLGKAQLASVLSERGELEAAEQYAVEALKGGGFFEFESRLVLAEVALARGDPHGERLAAEALSLTEAGGYLFSRTRKRVEAQVPRAERTPSKVSRRRRERRTFMFTDIVQSTNLVETIGDEGWDHLLRWHDHTLRSLFIGHHGKEVNRIGDGFLWPSNLPKTACGAQ